MSKKCIYRGLSGICISGSDIYTLLPPIVRVFSPRHGTEVEKGPRSAPLLGSVVQEGAGTDFGYRGQIRAVPGIRCPRPGKPTARCGVARIGVGGTVYGPRMDIDYGALFADALVNAVSVAAAGFATAFAADPWPVLGVGALMLVGFLVPTRRSRRRRRS